MNKWKHTACIASRRVASCICRRCTLVGEQPSWLSLPKRADRSCYRNEAYRKVTGPYLLVEDGLGLTTVTRLLTVVTTLSLRGQRILALLVLGHLVWPARRSKRVRISQALSRQESKERLTCASGTACPCSLWTSSQHLYSAKQCRPDKLTGPAGPVR